MWIKKKKQKTEHHSWPYRTTVLGRASLRSKTNTFSWPESACRNGQPQTSIKPSLHLCVFMLLCSPAAQPEMEHLHGGTPRIPGTGREPEGSMLTQKLSFVLFFLMAKSQTKKGKKGPPECHAMMSDEL